MVERNEKNAEAILKMWARTLTAGVRIYPRGEEVREIGDLQITVDPRYPFQSFDVRKYNFDYFREEMKWKLSANKYDESIKAHAKMWESVQNPDGTFNSNYGQYWFGEQKGFWTVVEELIRDKDSRRAVIPMLAKEHMSPQTKDTVCTESVGFRIRNNMLHMSAHMRSSDQVFGLGTDIPTFAFLQQLVFGMLMDIYPDLSLGEITVTAMSSHIYSRHYVMVETACLKGLDGYVPVKLPHISGPSEAMFIIASRGKRLTNLPCEYLLANWLFDQRKP